MGSSGGTGEYDESYIATESLEAAQYHFVMIATTGVALCTANASAIGVVQNAPASGADAEVRHFGVSKLVVNAANPVITAGMALESGTADGIGIKSTVAEHIVGAYALEAASTDGAIISVLLLGPSSVPT